MVTHLISLEVLGEFRQGDPLSPLLFDIVMEALSHMLNVAASTVQFSGFSMGSMVGPSMMVSHLFLQMTL